jgi:hypothetical protein
MAFNQQQKKMSYSMGTFFSSEKKGAEYQMIRLGFHNEKVTMNFLKGTSGGGGEGADAFVALDYDTACLLKSFVDGIIRHRVDRYRNGQVYDDLYVTYTISFTDKDTREARTVGTLTFKTSEATSERPSNTVHLIYENGSQTFDIALGNAYFNKAFTHTEELFADVDKGDGRLYAFAYLLHNILRSWPVLMQNDRIASVMMQRIQAIGEKLGIAQDTSSGEKYADKYRSNNRVESDASEDVPF